MYGDLAMSICFLFDFRELTKLFDDQAWWDYLKYGKGQYTSNGIDGMAFTATNYSQHADWPDIQLHFAGYSFATDGGVSLHQSIDCLP